MTDAQTSSPVLTDEDFDQVVNTSSTGRHAAVDLAIGAASACWDNLGGAGVFQSDRAKQISEDLIRYLHLEP